jgi:diguanylate cyclase (GGDEF)-like protein/PAS domain S-box-containing protein
MSGPPLQWVSLRQMVRLLLALGLSMLLVVTGLASVVAKGPEFEQLFRESGVVMLLVEPDSGRIVAANRSAAEFYGYSIEQLQRMTIQQINAFTPEQVAQERRLAQREGRNHFFFRHRLANGEIRSVEVHSRPYRFNGEDLLFSIVNDITPGRHEAQDLWHYQQQLEAMVDAQVSELERTRRLQFWLLVAGLLAQALVITLLIINIQRRRKLERERRRTTAALAQADRYRQIVLKFSSRFINLPLNQIESALADAMQEIGSFFDADRCHLFEYEFEHGTASLRYEWCAEGVEPQANKLQQLPIDRFPGWLERHGRGEPVVVAEREQAPDPFVAELLRSQGVTSLICQPLMDSGRCIGFIGISSTRRRARFGSETAAMLKLFAELLVSLKRRERHERQLSLSASVFDNANEGIMILDPDGRIISVNHAFCRTTGYSAEAVVGREPAFLISGRHGEQFHPHIWQALRCDGHWSGEVWNRHQSGELYAVLQKMNAFYDESGNLQGYVALLSDITTLKLQQRQLEQIAHFDPLTGLPNRTLLADRLQQAMVRAERHGSTIAVLFIDLDGFKAVNDTHSHAVGDQLLVQVAQRMKRVMREEDTLARLGGDEFVAVLQDLETPDASKPVLERLLRAAAEPVRVNGLELSVSASIGVVFYPQREAIEADQLQRQADQAMYQAKQAGKNRYHLFDVERDRAIRDQHESLERIREALYRGEFRLFYQPKVNMRTGAVIGCEALIRWHHPERGLLPPAAFLPMIENHPLAIELGHWVLCTALDQLLRWKRAGIELQLSINIDAIHLQHTGFVARLEEELRRRPAIRPGDLELEILETTALGDMVRVLEIITACQRLGVEFALDDFGTGYSSLTYLKRLPAQLLKIDRSFVRDMLDDPDDLAILEGVINLARAFRRSVIAEGVETQAHCQALLTLGCELGQGYAIARPMPEEELTGWLQRWPGQWRAEIEART